MLTRGLTQGERELAASIFRTALDPNPVRLVLGRWWLFQPRNSAMAPMGSIYFHPASGLWRDDYSSADVWLQGFVVHELMHVVQSQQRGKLYLPLMRHPFCRYSYQLVPGRAFESYGLEQQAEIVRHAFLLRRGIILPNAPSLPELEELLPF